MTKHQKAIKAQLDWVKERLTEKGYRDFLKAFASCSTEYFKSGGRFNWADYEKKTTSL